MHQGKILRQYVRNSGKTQTEFAISIGMTRQNLNNYFLKDELPHSFIKELEAKGHLLFVKSENQQETGDTFQIPLTGNKFAVLNYPRTKLTKGDIEILKSAIKTIEMSVGVDIDHSISEDTEKNLKKKHNQN